MEVLFESLIQVRQMSSSSWQIKVMRAEQVVPGQGTARLYSLLVIP